MISMIMRGYIPFVKWLSIVMSKLDNKVRLVNLMIFVKFISFKIKVYRIVIQTIIIMTFLINSY